MNAAFDVFNLYLDINGLSRMLHVNMAKKFGPVSTVKLHGASILLPVPDKPGTAVYERKPRSLRCSAEFTLTIVRSCDDFLSLAPDEVSACITTAELVRYVESLYVGNACQILTLCKDNTYVNV